jgi:hypothetical protein
MAVWDYKGIVICMLAVGCASAGDSVQGTQPTISAVKPSAGPTAGGVTVTIQGTNFPKDAVVEFNSVLAQNIVVVSDSEITATLPPSSGTVGKVAVTVNLIDGDSATRSDLFAYYYGALSFPAQPALTTGHGPRALALKDVINTSLSLVGTACCLSE